MQFKNLNLIRSLFIIDQTYKDELVFHGNNKDLKTILKHLNQAINNLDLEHPLIWCSN